jgi:hypothetical protein
MCQPLPCLHGVLAHAPVCKPFAPECWPICIECWPASVRIRTYRWPEKGFVCKPEVYCSQAATPSAGPSATTVVRSAQPGSCPRLPCVETPTPETVRDCRRAAPGVGWTRSRSVRPAPAAEASPSSLSYVRRRSRTVPGCREPRCALAHALLWHHDGRLIGMTQPLAHMYLPRVNPRLCRGTPKV